MADTGDRLPLPHPSFTAHFTDPVYDADDPANDDRAPFGTDEGWDEVHDWADRLDELRDDPTLRSMLGQDADDQIEELINTDQVDVEDIVIGLGFTLLRFTGQIDAEGRTWLLEALERQVGRGRGREYVTMRDDLSSFDAVAAPKETIRPHRKGRAVPRRPTEPPGWLSIDAPPLMSDWAWPCSRWMAGDLRWRAWWSTSGLPQLHVVLVPAGKGERLQFGENPHGLLAVARSAEVGRLHEKLSKGATSGTGSGGLRAHPKWADRLDAVLLSILREVSVRLDLGGTPDQLPGP